MATSCTIRKLRPGQKYSISIQYFATNNSRSKVMNATAVASKMLSEFATNLDICWTVVISYFIQIYYSCQLLLQCLFLVNLYFCIYFMFYIFSAWFWWHASELYFYLTLPLLSAAPLFVKDCFVSLLFSHKGHCTKSAPEIIQLTEIILKIFDIKIMQWSYRSSQNGLYLSVFGTKGLSKSPVSPENVCAFFVQCYNARKSLLIPSEAVASLVHFKLIVVFWYDQDVNILHWVWNNKLWALEYGKSND